MWVQGCSVIVSELSEVFLRDNVWIIYCLNLNNSCMSQCRVIIAVTMLSLVAVSRMWSPMPLTLHSLGSAFHFISNKELWVKEMAQSLTEVPSEVLKSFLLKIFISFYYFFHIQSLKSNLACFCTLEIKQGAESAPGWAEGTFCSLLQKQPLSSIISWSNSPRV